MPPNHGPRSSSASASNSNSVRLTTESSHPVTAALSEVARNDIGAALGLLFEADGDVVLKYREFAHSGRARSIADAMLQSLRGGGRLFFTGCGSTGRLSIQLVSIWREFWQRQGARGLASSPPPEHWGGAPSVSWRAGITP